MFKKFTRRLSTIIITLTLTFLSVPSLGVNAAADDVITIIHTNDMHGRLSQDLSDEGPTRLAALKGYAEKNNATLILDAGDAIQGLPISNINKGKQMMEALLEVGYDAMTIGNHEFDFGQDNLIDLKNEYDGKNGFRMLSSNVIKGGTSLFDSHDVIEKDGKKYGIIGVTTPETSTKTHPNNVTGITFADPYTKVKESLDALDGTVDLIVVLSHLGDDLETKDADRGDKLAEKIAGLNLTTNVVYIDGHAHTEIDPGRMYGNKVLYVQTGEYINNVGHVEVNFTDFTKSSGKLVPTNSIALASTDVKKLDAEKTADTDYDKIAGEVVIDNFPLDLVSDRNYARTQEIALGNLIADAVYAYGTGFAKQPDVAVINGGGIRADLNKGKLTKGHIIAVLPFGNMYSSIDVTGQQLIDMFEHSYRTDLVFEEGRYILNADTETYLLGQNGGFLHVAGAIIKFNPFNEAGNKITELLIRSRVTDEFEPVDPKGDYVLATNDFLAVGGDGYDMLFGERLEGDGLEEVLIRFLSNPNVDLSEYEEQFPLTRILPETYSEETLNTLVELIEKAKKTDTKDFTTESVKALEEAIEEAEAYFNKKRSVVNHLENDLLDLIDKLNNAVEGLAKPEAPETLVPVGITSGLYPAMLMIGLGISAFAVAKKEE